MKKMLLLSAAAICAAVVSGCCCCGGQGECVEEDVIITVPAVNKCKPKCTCNPCTCTGVCGNCLNETSICNQILITRNCKPAGRIKFVLVGEELGF